MAGAMETPAQYARSVVARFGRSDESTVFAAAHSSARASAAAAALVNGIASHTLELDDVHKLSTLHAAAPVISAAFAVAEREHAAGEALILAVALGYDTAFRIGEAVNPSHYRYWHPTGTAATFGAAAAAGSLIGLDGKQMNDAFGSAGTQAAGLWEFNSDGAMSKSLHPGKAAFNGIFSADLAREGFTGATRILEGDRGFFRAMCDNPDPTRITDRLGELWKITENWYKLHACCGHTHTAIDAAIAVRQQCPPVDIESIHLETYGPGWEIVKQQNPRSPVQARFSLVYCLAAGLCEGRVGIEQFSPDRFSPDGVLTPAIANIMARTRVSVAPDLTAKYPAAWPSRLTITLRDGKELKIDANQPRGNPDNPVSTADLEAKFETLIAPRFGNAEALRLLEWTRSLETCTDVADLFRALVHK
jgi:2-methylcitrate dehydratase PrpD